MSARKPNSSRTVNVVRLPHAKGLPLPTYQSDEAAGLDLIAAVPDDQPLMLPAGARVLVPTGLVIELPKGMEAQVRPRSGLALKHGITVLNSPGTIDSDYRGEVKVLLINLSDAPFAVARGERIAQMVVATVTHVRLVPRQAANETRRGTGGFGSTGTTPSAAKSKSKSRTASAASERSRKSKAVPKPRPSRKRLPR